MYRVAGSDWELEPHGPYADEAWQLTVDFDVPTILREAVEDYLRRHGRVGVSPPRLRA